jgi:hypothetical protein
MFVMGDLVGNSVRSFVFGDWVVRVAALAAVALLCNRRKNFREAVVGKGFVPSILRFCGWLASRGWSEANGFVPLISCMAGSVRRSGGVLGAGSIALPRASTRSIDVAELLIFWHLYTTGANIFGSRMLRAQRRKCVLSSDYAALNN